MKNSKLLLFLIISFLTIGLFSCNKTSTLEGIEITKSPTKVEYVEGELFDKTGMIISLIYSDKTKKETTDYIVDKTEKLTLDDNVVTITSGNFSVTLNITVKKVEMTDVEVKIKENTSYVRTMEIAQNIMYREVFSNGTFSNWETCVEEDIISKQIIGNKLEVKVSLYIQNKEYEKTVSFDINDESISVKTLLTKEINDEIHIVNGVLVGIASTNSHVEYLLMDKDTKQIVGVSGLEGEGKINDYQLDKNGFNIGDELQIPVKLIKVEEKEGLSDSNKVYAVYQGGTDYEMAIISNNNNLKINKENVVTISNQEELINFLNNENRQKNFYQVVKLHGKLNYIYYASSKQYRIFFDGVTKLSEQKIENCSPCFGSGSEYYTTGKTVGELLFNEDGFAPTDFKNPASLVKDIYTVFIGGNTYYHEFVILSEEDIEEVTPIFTNYTFEKPTNLSYSVNQTFDLTGGCIKENYDYGTSKTIPLTTEMLEQVPDMTTTGKKTITGTYNNYQFSFEIEVIDKQVTSIALKEELSNNEFSYCDGVEGIIILLSTKELLVNYNDDTSETINITENMISYQDNWEVGNFDLTITYMSKTTTINTLVYLKTTTVEEIKKETVEANLQYDLVGIIIGYDSMGTDYSKDDVLILADPYDVDDHYQDGYTTVPSGRFYRWWFNVDKAGNKTDEFSGIIVEPKTKITFERIDEKQEIIQNVPERHLLLNADGSFGGTRDQAKYGSIPEKNGETDSLNSIYYSFVDYYNMQNSQTRLILSNYKAFQQTMASSCGICSTLSVLNYYDVDVTKYDELWLTEKYCEVNDKETIKNVGVGSSGLKKLVAVLGFNSQSASYSKANYVDENSMIFSTYETFTKWVTENLQKGTPMPISWRPMNGHWEVIIGYDTMGTENPYDDVIVLADSHDTYDHYQDGYNTLPAYQFYRQWYNGSFTYNQQYNVFDNK